MFIYYFYFMFTVSTKSNWIFQKYFYDWQLILTLMFYCLSYVILTFLEMFVLILECYGFFTMLKQLSVTSHFIFLIIRIFGAADSHFSSQSSFITWIVLFRGITLKQYNKKELSINQYVNIKCCCRAIGTALTHLYSVWLLTF